MKIWYCDEFCGYLVAIYHDRTICFEKHVNDIVITMMRNNKTTNYVNCENYWCSIENAKRWSLIRHNWVTNAIP